MVDSEKIIVVLLIVAIVFSVITITMGLSLSSYEFAGGGVQTASIAPDVDSDGGINLYVEPSKGIG